MSPCDEIYKLICNNKDITTQQIADTLGISKRTVLRKLSEKSLRRMMQFATVFPNRKIVATLNQAIEFAKNRLESKNKDGDEE